MGKSSYTGRFMEIKYLIGALANKFVEFYLILELICTLFQK